MEGNEPLAMDEREELEETEEAVEGSSDGKKKIIKIALISVVGLALNGFLAYYITSSYVIPEYFNANVLAANGEENVAIIKPVINKVKTTPNIKPKKTKSASVDKEMIFISVNHLVINPYGTNGRRFLALNLSIGTFNKDAIKEIEKRDAELRDKFNTFLSRKTVAELTNIISKRKIKKDIVSLLNGVLKNGKVEEVYFTKYVLQ